MSDDLDWTTDKMCTDVDGYELIVERQKNGQSCSQKRESWKWLISYHGSIVASGSVQSAEDAQILAFKNLPISQQQPPR